MTQRTFSLLSFVFVAVLAGCGLVNAGAVAFNDKMVSLEKPIEAQAEEFNQAMESYDGSPEGKKKIDDLLAKIISSLENTKQKLQAINVPNIKYAKEFHRAYGAYFDDLIPLYKNEMPRMVELMPKAKAGQVDAATKLMGAATAIEAKTNKTMAALAAAQQEYARQNGMRIEK